MTSPQAIDLTVDSAVAIFGETSRETIRELLSSTAIQIEDGTIDLEDLIL